MRYLILLVLFLTGCADVELKSYSCIVTHGDFKSYWAINAYSPGDAEHRLRNEYPGSGVDCE
jgi:hypothetical protein